MGTGVLVMVQVAPPDQPDTGRTGAIGSKSEYTVWTVWRESVFYFWTGFVAMLLLLGIG